MWECCKLSCFVLRGYAVLGALHHKKSTRRMFDRCFCGFVETVIITCFSANREFQQAVFLRCWALLVPLEQQVLLSCARVN